MHEEYDPNAPGKKGSIFGFPYTQQEANIVLLPLAWDVTSSYHSGSSNGPQSILDASVQLDLEIPDVQDAWSNPVFMLPNEENVRKDSEALRTRVEPYLSDLEQNYSDKKTDDSSEIVTLINRRCQELNSKTKDKCDELINAGKIVGIVGGDHGTPLGLVQSLTSKYESIGILQIDAHMDLRNAYEGFEFSHASIMRNCMKSNVITSLVQVGIRDYCQEELSFCKHDHRISVYFDQKIKEALDRGASWSEQCDRIIDQLPEHVYVSFDIDGLDPKLCPGTGTPVPGGLEFWQVVLLLQRLATNGKHIIGFDLCEVAPVQNDREWNANVGARILYQLTTWTAVSHGLLTYTGE